jgi:oligopeptide transport system substrate-binding protein
MKNKRHDQRLFIGGRAVKAGFWLFLTIFLFSCGEIKAPKPEPFIGENVPPPKQEFRWSNGKMPKSFDPARSAASPETDLVRALFEGLTDVDARELKAVPALATKWSASEDYRVWTFELRREAKWSNGKPVVAQDFVDSWKRLTELGSRVPQRGLLKNIVGMDAEDAFPVFAEEPGEEIEAEEEISNALGQPAQSESNVNAPAPSTPKPAESPAANSRKPEPVTRPKGKNEARFGVEALSSFVLKITLVHPDREFPLLVAHPMFYPIHGDGKEFETTELNSNFVTSGAFRLISVGKDGIILERSPGYWNREQVQLERVRFVPTENAESALAAYRAGEVDAVTNANFQPLALKLLRPFEKEFHQIIHGAVNFYEFNLDEKPFNDLRVREALAISIEREQITEDEMDGATRPALGFLPFASSGRKLTQDIEKARKLLAEAGYAGGENFPTIKLVINRNNLQQRIARSVARMWQKNLNLKTEVIVRDPADLQNTVQTGDFSLTRRGVVLPTNNEISNMLAMFDGIRLNPAKTDDNETSATYENRILTDKTAESTLDFSENENSADKQPEVAETPVEHEREPADGELILTEEQALAQLPAIPLYFPTSYSLVKPYIQGFDLNAFDALSLKNVRIDSTWQPADPKNGSKN